MFYKLPTRLLLCVLAILLVAYFVPGIDVDGFTTALVVALILGVINITLKPILFLLTLPVTILTLGLFVFVLNALFLWFVASFVEGFAISSFLSALLGSIVISFTTWLGSHVLERD